MRRSIFKAVPLVIKAVVGGGYLDKRAEDLLKLVFFPFLEAGRIDEQDPIPVKLGRLFVRTLLTGCTRPRREPAFLARARPEQERK